MRRITAIFLALAMSLSLTATAFADTINETLTISSAMSMTGVPASISYGTVTPGTPSAAQTFTLTVSSNVAWRVDTTGSDFTGPGTLTKAARQVMFSNFGGSPPPATNLPGWTGYDHANLADLSTVSQPDVYGNAGSGETLDVSLRINAGYVTPGAYTGTVQFVMAAS